jgi:hypothetical protein
MEFYSADIEMLMSGWNTLYVTIQSLAGVGYCRETALVWREVGSDIDQWASVLDRLCENFRVSEN